MFRSLVVNFLKSQHEEIYLMDKARMVVGVSIAIAVMVGLITTENANCLWGLIFILWL